MSITKERYKLSPDSFCIGDWWKGKKRKPFTQEHKNKIAEARKYYIMPSGENHYRWKGGISKNRKEWFKDWRLKTGRTKNNRSDFTISNTKAYKKMQKQKYRYLKKNGGELTLKTIQMVYEDNIKQYGTLTCYLCLKPIPFGKDHLEHKTPLSRGGNNEYNNLAIACQKCNCKKHNKTEVEFRKEIL